MLQAMEDTGIAEPLRAGLLKAFFGTADWMPNRQESAPGPPEIPKVLTEPLRIYKQRQVP